MFKFTATWTAFSSQKRWSERTGSTNLKRANKEDGATVRKREPSRCFESRKREMDTMEASEKECVRGRERERKIRVKVEECSLIRA